MGNLARFGLLVLGGFLFGLITTSIPAPQDPETFWVSNFGSLWVVLPFLAGWVQRTSLPWAMVTAVVATEAGMLGFYGRLIWLAYETNDRSLSFAFSFASFWFASALVTGIGAGLLGALWGRSRSLLAGIAISLPFVVEPWAWRWYMGFLPMPYWIWVFETMVGLAVAVIAIVVWRQHRTRTAAAAAVPSPG